MSVGGYRLSPALKEEFFDFTSFSGDEQPEQGDVKLHGGMYYLTRDIYNPDIGDLRIQFYFAGRAGEMVRVGEGVERGGTGGEKGKGAEHTTSCGTSITRTLGTLVMHIYFSGRVREVSVGEGMGREEDCFLFSDSLHFSC